MDNFLLRLVQERLELLRRPKPLISGNELGTDLRLEDNQLSARHDVFERIKHIERQIAPATIEIAVAFDSKGNILAIKYGQVSRVTFDWKQEQLITNTCIITHNHPNHSYFSSDDIAYIHRIKAAELRAVAGNTVHRLLCPIAGWDNEKLNELWKNEVGKLKHRAKIKKITQEQVEETMRKFPQKLVDSLSLFTQPDSI